MPLDWVPLHIHRLKGSKAWKRPCDGGLTDFQFGWYMKLLIEAADRGGYLPGSVSELWQIAGAKSEPYFVKWGGSELVSRYFRRTDDGTNRIYNPKMLAVLGEAVSRLEKSPHLPLFLSKKGIELEVLKSKTEELFRFYVEQLHRNSTYTLTKKRAAKCQRRLVELMEHQGLSLEEACEKAKEAISNLAGSEWHVANGHIDWEGQIFRSQEEFQKRLEARPRHGTGTPIDREPGWNAPRETCGWCDGPAPCQKAECAAKDDEVRKRVMARG